MVIMRSMKGLVERIFPIRVQISSEQERIRLGDADQNKEPFSYKRLERACCHDEPQPTSDVLLQGFGTILGLQCVGVDHYKAVFASDNSLQVLGTGHGKIFALSSFCDIIIESDRAGFVARLGSILDREKQAQTHSVTFQCSIQSSGDASASFWCTAHKPKGRDDVVICEFEPFHSHFDGHEKVESTMETPTKIFSYQPSAEEWTKSTTRTSRPLYPWYGLMNEPNPKSSTDLINAITEVQTQLISTASIESLFGVIVGTVSELTDFDRVMLYRFDECKCGAVVAEYLRPQVSEDLLIGLHFPSSDLPVWVRELYKEDRVQLLRNRTYKKTSIVYRNIDELAQIDLTKAYLREVAPDKVQLFADLNVSSAMCISLVVDGELWGLIMCHSYGQKVVEISPPAREVFRTIGDCVSSQIERLTYAERLDARMLLATGLSQKSPAAFITGSSSSLLQLFTSEYGFLVMDDEARAVGKLESYQEALVLVQYFRARGVTSVMASQKITADFPDLVYAPGFSYIAGLLAIPLSASGSDFLIFFRREQLMEIHWAGNTQERFELLGNQNVEPAASFQRWVEHVVNTSREWTEWQIEIAGVLSTLYGTFTDFWRKRQQKIQKSRMRQLLIANSSHEVRTPLNHIINYLELTLDVDLDQAARTNIEASLKASKSLLYVINDLLDLTKVEDSDMLMHEEPFSLREIMLEVVGAYAKEAERKGLAILFKIDPIFGIDHVIGDPQRLRQAVSNILSNSLAHSNRGSIVVEIFPVKADTGGAEDTLTISVRDEGNGMSEQQLDHLFLQLENILDEEEEEEEEARDEDNSKSPVLTAALGLGLSVVARFVRNSSGQMKIETVAGRGTRVSLLLPLRTISGAQLHPPLLTPPSDFALRGSTATSSTPIVGDIRSSETVNFKKSSDSAGPPILSPLLATTVSSANSTSERDSFPFPPTDHISLRVLVAEDNPLNAKVVKMQLTKMGHKVSIVGDGQACLDRFISDSAYFDMILMDFQMPLVDGPASAKAIRSFERDFAPKLSNLAAVHKQIPIFAVSASLEENKREEYIEAGFNGWTLKPIRFRRLNTMMSGIWNEDVKKQCLYSAENWEQGGWLT